MKPFKEIDEQIELLDRRGLTIKNDDKTKKYLLSNNYYNIINGYSKFFQEDTDRYIPGSTFDEVATLYNFDKDIKRAILQSILHAEHHLKSITAHRFAERYRDKRYSYLDTSSYADDSILEVGYTISKLSKIIKLNKKRQTTSICHYVKQYNDVPIWVITDYLEFGDLRSIIENLPTSLQNKISLDLVSFIKSNNPNFGGVFYPETMTSLLKNINQTRNICAHNNRLLNYKCHADSNYFGEIHDEFNLSSDGERRTVFSTVLSLKCFISGAEFNHLWNTLHKKVNKLEKKITSININEINRSLGFPDDWHKQEARK